MNHLIENKIGRWKLSNNNKIISIKIDQANEDHCGCCNVNQPIIYNNKIQSSNNNNNNNENYYSYFCT
jgi:hypothetical protein